MRDAHENAMMTRWPQTCLVGRQAQAGHKCNGKTYPCPHSPRDLEGANSRYATKLVWTQSADNFILVRFKQQYCHLLELIGIRYSAVAHERAALAL